MSSLTILKYIVFEGLLAVMCLVCGIVLLLGVVFSLVACNGVQQLCGRK